MKKTEPFKNSATRKLIAHLFKHERYVIHYRNLNFLLELGVRVTHVHEILTLKKKKIG